MMTGTDTIRDKVSMPVAAGTGDERKSRVRQLSGRFGRRLGQCAAGISTAALTISVAAIAMAQQENIYMKSAETQFKSAPKSPEAEAGAAALVGDTILGIPVNTIFFIAAGGIALLWFTIGGGRKPKVAPRS